MPATYQEIVFPRFSQSVEKRPEGKTETEIKLKSCLPMRWLGKLKVVIKWYKMIIFYKNEEEITNQLTE